MSSAIVHSVDAKLNLVDSAFPGESAVSVVGLTRFKGQEGAMLVLRNKEALALSDTSIGTLRGGTYQLVQILLGATIAPALGYGVFWNDLDDFVVTTDVPTQPGAQFAGVLISAPTKGNWCWIQVEGIANIQFHSNDTETVVVGDTAFITSDTGGTFNNLADATAITAGNANDIVGQFLAVIASDGIGLMALNHVVVNR